MKQIRLEGITATAKKKILKCGPFWAVHIETDTILFSDIPGPWLYVSPTGSEITSVESMWIKQENDISFKIIAND